MLMKLTRGVNFINIGAHRIKCFFLAHKFGKRQTVFGKKLFFSYEILCEWVNNVGEIERKICCQKLCASNYLLGKKSLLKSNVSLLIADIIYIAISKWQGGVEFNFRRNP